VRVVVDGRALRPGAARARGVARYLRCLLEELRRQFPEDEYELVDPGRRRLATAALVRRPRLDRLARSCDVVWLPAPAPVAVSNGTPYVLTVHDLSFEHRARDYPLYDRLWQHLARPAMLARGADRVLCVSDATRTAAIEEWGIEQDRARTVLSGPGRAPAARSAPGGARSGLAAAPAAKAGALPPDLPESFLLAVGALEPRKLPGVVVHAHSRARAQGLRAGLVFAGDGPLRGGLEGGDALLLGHVADAALDALYERALAVVCPSREEGFGFTPLEAAAHGTPAVVADLPVFDETLGDAALRVPPGDPARLAEALLRLEREPGLRDRLGSAARDAASRLSWARAARETRSVLLDAHRQGSDPFLRVVEGL
jgi:glycosyltransferase involved in cell wall biosynthesis